MWIKYVEFLEKTKTKNRGVCCYCETCFFFLKSLLKTLEKNMERTTITIGFYLENLIFLSISFSF